MAQRRPSRRRDRSGRHHHRAVERTVDERERLSERSFAGDGWSGPIGEDIDDGAVVPARAQVHDEPGDVALECADAMRVHEVTELVEVRIHASMVSAPIHSVQR